jgi:epoxide hydrolase-like predicted phosphatase
VIDRSIKTLVFDLGGVILDLSVPHTLQSFSAISGIDKATVQEIFETSPGFNEYERGGMTDDEFRQYLKKIYNVKVSDSEIDTCWNAMLRGIPAVKLNLLKDLQKQFKVLLLSNTNEIHLMYMNSILLPLVTKEKSLDNFFHKAYYSHRMLKRKPEVEIFQQVLDENGLRPSETLFLDDNKFNIESAASIGIKTVHVTYPDLILEYFNA